MPQEAPGPAFDLESKWSSDAKNTSDFNDGYEEAPTEIIDLESRDLRQDEGDFEELGFESVEQMQEANKMISAILKEQDPEKQREMRLELKAFLEDPENAPEERAPVKSVSDIQNSERMQVARDQLGADIKYSKTPVSVEGRTNEKRFEDDPRGAVDDRLAFQINGATASLEMVKEGLPQIKSRLENASSDEDLLSIWREVHQLQERMNHAEGLREGDLAELHDQMYDLAKDDYEGAKRVNEAIANVKREREAALFDKNGELDVDKLKGEVEILIENIESSQYYSRKMRDKWRKLILRDFPNLQDGVKQRDVALKDETSVGTSSLSIDELVDPAYRKEKTGSGSEGADDVAA